MSDLSDIKTTFERVFKHILKSLLKGDLPVSTKSLNDAFSSKFPVCAKLIKDNLTEQDIFEGAGRYIKRIEEKYDNIRILDMSEPVPLRNIFVRVNILEKMTSHIPINPMDLEKWDEEWRKCNREFGRLQETKQGLEAIKEKDKVIVLGKPGAGKTTFLKYIVLNALDCNFEDPRIPVFISLKDWSDSKEELISFIVQQFSIYEFPEAGPYVELMLEKGNLLLLLDGFDEVTEDIAGTIQQIKDFSDKYHKNKYVLSCRIAAWNYVFEHFSDMEIADFNDEQIHTFICNWFGENKKKACSCWNSMKEKSTIKELASNPLLLTMLCLSFDDTMEFPSNRSELYADAINALLSKWDSSRNIQRRKIYENLSKERKIQLLSQIAARTFEKGIYFIRQRELESEIADYIQHLPQTSDDSIDVDSQAVLKSIESQHGLIVERANGIYSFSHLSFHEYFTAKYIVDNEARGCLGRLVGHDLLEPKWREIVLLTAGMLQNADEFLVKIRNWIGQLADTKLKRYLKQSERVVLSSEAVSPSLCRLLVIVSSLKCKCYNEEKFDDYFKNDDLVRKLARAGGINLDFDLELDSKLVSKMSKESVASLESYLKGIELLVDCMNADCYLSRDVRKQLMDGLLMEPWELDQEKKKKGYSWTILESRLLHHELHDENTVVITIPDLQGKAIPLQFGLIPAGDFLMGSPDNEKGRYKYESPLHSVKISNDFYLGKYPITQAQWEAVMGENPSNFSDNPNHPVECVSWNDCQEFLKKINHMGLGKFRLPTEAEWEYACRVETTTRYYWGDDSEEKEIWKHTWYNLDVGVQTHTVGKKQPNAWGLYDMSGNVWEWCEDDWHDNYKGAPEDGRVWTNSDKSRGSSRVLRGGCWGDAAWDCRSAARAGGDPAYRSLGIGFRVVCSRT